MIEIHDWKRDKVGNGRNDCLHEVEEGHMTVLSNDFTVCWMSSKICHLE